MASENVKSEKGLTVKKGENFSEWFSQVVAKAELADMRCDVQGFIVHQSWGMRILRKLYELLEQAVEEDGHEPVLFPTVIPEENLKKEEEHAGFTPEVFWISHAGEEKLERKLALRPTGETQFYPMYALWIRSYNDLPFKRYQSRITVFRNEMATRPFLRGREFMFFETHDVFESHEHALAQIRKDMEIMETVVHQQLKIPFIFFKRPQWDKFKGADATFASDTMNPDGRRNQISSTHDLGQNFAKAFGIQFVDRNGKLGHPWQTCFGPGVWRIMAALISVHGDDKGLVLPFAIAPIQLAIVPITFSGKEKENSKVFAFGKKLEAQLKKAGYRVQIDAREGITPGEKYNLWELKGVPIRVELGPREVKEKKVTLVKRTDGKRAAFIAKGIEKEIKKQAEALDGELHRRSDEYFKDNVRQAATLQDVKKIFTAHRAFIRAPFCSMEKAGEKCAETVKAETQGAVVCGTTLESAAPAKGVKCAICGKQAMQYTFLAKTI